MQHYAFPRVQAHNAETRQEREVQGPGPLPARTRQEHGPRNAGPQSRQAAPSSRPSPGLGGTGKDGEEGRARPSRHPRRRGPGRGPVAWRPGTCASSAQRRRPRRPQGLLLGEEAAHFVLLLIDRAGAVRTAASGAGPAAALRRASENAASAAPTSTGTGSSVKILSHARPGRLKRFEWGGGCEPERRGAGSRLATAQALHFQFHPARNAPCRPPAGRTSP